VIDVIAVIVSKLVGITSWEWIVDRRHLIQHLFIQHLQLTAIAVMVGFAISFPLAVVAYRHPRLYPPITWLTGLLYTIPSVALFALLLPITGLTKTTAEVGLVSYTLLILIRNTVVGLRAVPEDVKDAARGMGYTPRQLLWRVEVPLAVPAIVAGIRIATVSTIGLVTVAGLIGRGGLGQLMFEGLRILYTTELVVGASLSVALALVADAALLLGQRSITPWARAKGSPRTRPWFPPRKAGVPLG
jgi:osmoprotectant transport system permease protein